MESILVSNEIITMNETININKYNGIQIILNVPVVSCEYMYNRQIEELNHYAEKNGINVLKTYKTSEWKDMMNYIFIHYLSIDLIMFSGFTASWDKLDQFYFDTIYDELSELLIDFNICICPCLKDITTSKEIEKNIIEQNVWLNDSKLKYMYSEFHKSGKKIPFVYIKSNHDGQSIDDLRSIVYPYCYENNIIFSERVWERTSEQQLMTEGFKKLVAKSNIIRRQFPAIQFSLTTNNMDIFSDKKNFHDLYEIGITQITFILPKFEKYKISYNVLVYPDQELSIRLEYKFV